jgi:hypothetical protein
METPHDNAPLDARPPTLGDLVDLCRRLNEAEARYLVVGGMAIIQHGLARATGDIDLLVDTAPDNFERIKSAMLGLPDGAIREVGPGDLDQYVVVRVGDEFVVDLMKAACGVEYAEASKDIVLVPIQGVPIPFAAPRLMWRLKQTYREKDALDRLFLRELLKDELPPGA